MWLIACATAKGAFLFRANIFSKYIFASLHVYCRYGSTAAKLINSTDSTLQSIINSVSIMVELPFNVSQFQVTSHLAFSVEHSFSNYGMRTTTDTPTIVTGIWP
jgi:hypothetical protein